jgi:3-hydroxyacyl-CoA dehydrogenase
MGRIDGRIDTLHTTLMLVGGGLMGTQIAACAAVVATQF